MADDAKVLWLLLWTGGYDWPTEPLGIFSSRERAIAEATEHRGEGELRQAELYQLVRMMVDDAEHDNDIANEELNL